MPMIWLDLKEAGIFSNTLLSSQFILKNYGENPDNYNEQLKKLETLGRLVLLTDTVCSKLILTL
uniref:Uncharacterized protein n=1 Tax=Labrus bergylta TaxID=56723 RepID=A0A3Q3EQC5_9LABR